jgi:hypothetical protein
MKTKNNNSTILRIVLALLAIFIAIDISAHAQTTVSLIPIPLFPSFSNTGAVNSNGFVYTYVTGTSTPLATYTDYTGATQNTNPIQLNGAGFPETSGGSQVAIWVAAGIPYRIVVQNSAHVQQYVIDGIIGSAIQPVTIIGAPSVSSSGTAQGFAAIPLAANTSYYYRCHGWYANTSSGGAYNTIKVAANSGATYLTAGIRMFSNETGSSVDTSNTVTGTASISLSNTVGSIDQGEEFWVEGSVLTNSTAQSLIFTITGNASGTASVLYPSCVAFP